MTTVDHHSSIPDAPLPSDRSFDRLARLAARLLDAPGAAIYMAEEDHDHCRSRFGAPPAPLDERTPPLDVLLSRRVSASAEPLLIRDATSYTLTAGQAESAALGMAAFAGVPLIASRGHILGTLCVFDSRARDDWTDAQLQDLHDVASAVVTEIELRLVTEEHGAAREALLECEARSRTERRSAEEELQLQRALLEELFYSAPEAIVLLDPDHHVIRVNPEFTRIFGYSGHEIAGMPIDNVIGGADLHAEAVSITRRIMDGETIGLETMRRHKDGSKIHVSLIGAPICVGGDVVAVYGIYRDITGRKAAELRLREAEAHYRHLVENSPYGIYTLDAEGRFTKLNPAAAAVLGRSPEELLGAHFSEVVAPEELEYAEELFDGRIEGGPVSEEFEVHVMHRSGERRLVRINASIVESSNGAPAVHSIARDITDERAREAQLRRAERLATVGTLVGGVAHELNNPLTAIKNFAQLMLLEEPSPDDAESLEIIRREADRAAKIIADLRLLAGQTQHVGDGYRTHVDLNEVVRHVLRVRNYALDTYNIQVDEALEDGLALVSAVPSEMDQVVLNLIINAEHAMLESDGERRLSVRTYMDGPRACLRVEDRGTGISAQHLERIFDPFWTTKEPGVGTGLGLSLVHGIVTDHGGTIYVDSVPGQGTTFTLEFPAADTTPTEAESSCADPALSSGKTALRVLIVDDEDSIRDSLTRYLERRGHHVDEAPEGGEALARIAAAASGGVTFDVILADLRMPGLGGEELLARLQDRGEGWADRLIFITGDAVSGDAERILETAGVPVVLKPFELADIAAAVEERAGLRVQAASWRVTADPASL